MSNNFIVTKTGWVTVIDLVNRVIVHVTIDVTELKVDKDKDKEDPDGVPLVWIGGKHITRVRKMTDDEFVRYAKKYGLKIEVDMCVTDTESGNQH